MPAELDPRQIAAAHVGFPGEGLLTQATGRPQPLELLRQGVHARLIVTDLAQAVNRTIVAFCGQLWTIPGHWTLEADPETPSPHAATAGDPTPGRVASFRRPPRRP